MIRAGAEMPSLDFHRGDSPPAVVGLILNKTEVFCSRR
jgi:hypothetical protein